MGKLTPSPQAVLATRGRDQRRPTCRMAAVKRYRLAIQADGGMPFDDAAGAVAILGAPHHVPHHCHRLALQQIVDWADTTLPP